MSKKCTYEMVGLDCAVCSQKIVDEIKALPGVRDANYNLLAQEMVLEVAEAKDYRQLLQEVADRIEPGVQVQAIGSQPAGPVSHQAWLMPVRLGVALVFLVAGLFLVSSEQVRGVLFLISYLLAGYDILARAVGNIVRGQVFDENFLMALASLAAIAIGEHPEGVAVMVFYQVGEYFQMRAVGSARASIASLLHLAPDVVHLWDGQESRDVAAQSVAVGQVFQVRPGEAVPLDGEVLAGASSLDTSALTGEHLPLDVAAGDFVRSGSINGAGLLTMRANKVYEDSTVAQILALVQSSGARKAKTEQFITVFARYYTPIVVIVALLLAVVPPLVVPGEVWAKWIYRAVVFLVVSCPCALVISIPLGFFGGIGALAKRGILVKGSNYLEAMSKVSTVVFDKTGTLTEGRFYIKACYPAPGVTADELLMYAAYGEYQSNHPIARSIVAAYQGRIIPERLDAYVERPGYGVVATYAGKTLLVGKESLLVDQGINVLARADVDTLVHIAYGGAYHGALAVGDQPKETAQATIQGLQDAGVQRTIMLSGDQAPVVAAVAEALGLDGYEAGLLPTDKVAHFEQIQAQAPKDTTTLYVGDGMNDAPVLARADVGIAMGGLGSDAAIEAADVVIMNDDPYKLVEAIVLSRYTKSVVLQNIVLALGVKGVVLILGAFGLASMWLAVFADVGVAIIAVLSAMRPLFYRQSQDILAQWGPGVYNGQQ